MRAGVLVLALVVCTPTAHASPGDAMQEAKPDGKFPGFTHVDDLAAQIVNLWSQPAAEVNGTRVRLAP